MPSPRVIDRARFERAMRDAGWWFAPALELEGISIPDHWTHDESGAVWADAVALHYWQMTGRTPHPF